MGNRTNKYFALSPNSLKMATLLAFVGGFLDAYTYITRDAVFATAQTGNMVLFAVRAASTEYNGAILNIPPFLAFVAGVFVAEYIKIIIRAIDEQFYYWNLSFYLLSDGYLLVCLIC